MYDTYIHFVILSQRFRYHYIKWNYISKPFPLPLYHIYFSLSKSKFLQVHCRHCKALIPLSRCILF